MLPQVEEASRERGVITLSKEEPWQFVLSVVR